MMVLWMDKQNCDDTIFLAHHGILTALHRISSPHLTSQSNASPYAIPDGDGHPVYGGQCHIFVVYG